MNDQVKLITQKEATKVSWGRFQSNRNKEWGLSGHDTGLHPLNMMIGGWVPGKVTTIGARSGTGKTALTVQMFSAGNRILTNRRAEFLFFTWEMEPSFLVDRHICHTVGITNRMLVQGAKLLREEALKSVASAYKVASGLPVLYQPHSTDIANVKKAVLTFVDRCKEKEKIEGVEIQPVVLIDYLGMAQFDNVGLRTYGIGDFVNGCKHVANDTGCSFCIFTQINRSADDKDFPSRTDFSDSQSIEMASDNLILLHRPEYYGDPLIKLPSMPGQPEQEIDSRNKLLLRVLKGRDTGTGDKLINCNIKFFRFWDYDHQWEYEYWKLYSEESFWLDFFNLRKPTPVRQLKIAK